MKKSFSKFFVALIIGILIAVSLPVSAFAAEDGLREEAVVPYLYCAFYDSTEAEVDGNRLPAGTYRVEVRLDGMASLSVLQYTAEYDPSVVTSLSTEETIADNVSDMSLGGIKVTDADGGMKRVVIVLASTDETGTVAETDHPGTLIATLNVTIACAEGSTIDFQDYFRFVTDPDLTFAEADYHNGIEDAYVLDTTVETSYEKYEMTADESPENELEPDTITVSGTVVWSTVQDGSMGTYGARGIKFQIKDENDVFVDITDEQGNLITTADDFKANYGKFTITIPTGTTEIKVLAVEDKVGLPRTVTLSGEADITDAVIPYHVCDYNASGTMNVTDDGAFSRRFKAKNFYADLNNSDTYNVTDEGAFDRFSSKTISYADLSLD
jgi:hypothetical protein